MTRRVKTGLTVVTGFRFLITLELITFFLVSLSVMKDYLYVFDP